MADAGIGEAAAAEGAKGAGEAATAATAATGATAATAGSGLGVLGTIGAGVGTAVATSLLGRALQPGNPSVQAPPPVASPTIMPTANGAQSQQAQQTSIADQLVRRGRASTILTNQTNNTDKLGGD